MNPLKVGILGVGAIGSVMAAILQHQDLSLRLYNRSSFDVIKIRKPALEISIPIQIHTSVDVPPALDWLIICLKEQHFTAAQSWFRQLISAHTKVAVIRNGLRLKDPILDFTTTDKILECMIDCPTQPIEKRYYQQFSIPKLSLPSSPLAAEFESLFISDDIIIQTVADFRTSSWKKLCESAAVGAILCLSGETCWIFKDEEIRILYQKILAEAISVAKADGAKIEDDFIKKMLQKLLAYPDHKGSSMLTDRKNGRPIELGAKNGIISRLGAFYQVSTPINDMVCTLLKHTNKNN